MVCFVVKCNCQLIIPLNYMQKHSPDVARIERYDPAFILRFSVHSLSTGYIEPMEFASLGLLAISFVSMSSPDDTIRRLAYDTLVAFKNALEVRLVLYDFADYVSVKVSVCCLYMLILSLKQKSLIFV